MEYKYIYLAKIVYPYEDNEVTIGAYSTKEKAKEALKNELNRYQYLSSRTDSEMKRIINFVETQELDKEI